jgi:hypothetical protein
MNRIFETIRRALRWLRAVGRERVAPHLKPPEEAWRGAALAIVALAVVYVGLAFFRVAAQPLTFGKLLAFVILAGGLVLAGAASWAALRLLSRLPRVLWLTLSACLPLVSALLIAGAGGKGTLVLVGGVGLAACLIGGAFAVLPQRGRSIGAWGAAVAGVLLLVGVAWVIAKERDAPNPALAEYRLEDRTLPLADPSLPGPYEVAALTYGTGEDLRRPEYGPQVDLTSGSVDGSPFVEGWKGIVGWARTNYWGFDATALPLQGRIWAPQGSGPFPLVLTVHGNHDMEDFSDPGYAYLGELLASRGFLFVSVDENFLNSSLADLVNPFDSGLEEENDARAWMLLEHLRLWDQWNQTAGHHFEGKVDLERVLLIGHSRGGEAVAVAGLFNQLSAYPDDATVAFPYGYGIRGVVSIAPVDGQYRPRGVRANLVNTNYLTLHGSLDGDVTSFAGSSIYTRASVERSSPEELGFKASVYVVGANHGQFNTNWGACDVPSFYCWTLDREALMPAADQRQVALVYLSAFAEVVLHERWEYLPVFRDPRSAAAWLPATVYRANYHDSRERILASYEEDADPATAVAGKISYSHLSRIDEQWIPLKWGALDTHGVRLAWDDRVHEEPGRYSLMFEEPMAGSELVFRAAQAEMSTLPEDWEAEEQGNEDPRGAQPEKEETDAEEEEDEEAGDESEAEALDWHVCLRDEAGMRSCVALSSDEPLYPAITGRTRIADLFESGASSEVVLRRFSLPLELFVGVDPSRLVEVEMVFDLSRRGAVLFDDLGLLETAELPVEIDHVVGSH